MSVRIHLTIPDEVGDMLSRWAKRQGRPTANLASHLVEDAVRQADANGQIPPLEDEQQSISSAISPLLAKLIDGEALTPEEEEQLAEACDREPPDIHQASKKIRQQRRNGDAKARA